jgi:hypothetical protein
MLTLGYLLRNASWFLSLMQFDSDTLSSILGPLKRVLLHSTLLAAIQDSHLESALPNPLESHSQRICSCKSKVIIFPSSSILRLAMHSLLAFEGSLFIKKALSGASSLLAGGLLAFIGGTLVDKALAGRHLEAMALVLPQFVDCPISILVGAFRAGVSPKKNGPPGRFWRQQAGGLLVFAKCSLEPFLVANGTTNIGRGIEFLIIIKHPVGGAWGRLQLFVLQPPGRIGEGGRGQMGQWWSTIPHLWRRMRKGVSTHLYLFQRREVCRNYKINEEGGPINPIRGSVCLRGWRAEKG